MIKHIKLINSKGVVFIVTLWTALVLFLIVSFAAYIVSQDSHMINRLKNASQALFLAEAGIAEALAVITNNGISAKDDPANFPETAFEEGTYDVNIIEESSRIMLHSTGTVNNATRTSMAEIEDTFPTAMNCALAAGTDIDIKSVNGDIIIKGDIHANNNLILKEQGSPSEVRIEASATASGMATSSNGFSTDGNVNIADSANSGGGRPEVSMPSFDFLSFKNAAIADGTYYDNDKTFNNAGLSGGSAGIIYVDGDVTFKGDCTIEGGFVARGSITLNNGNSITQTHDAGNLYPIFMSEAGDMMKLYGLFNTTEGNIVYATNNVKIRTPGGSSVVLGCVLAGGSFDIVANNDLILNYGLISSETVITGGLELVSWNE